MSHSCRGKLVQKMKVIKEMGMRVKSNTFLGCSIRELKSPIGMATIGMATIAGGVRSRETPMAWGAHIKAELVFETPAQEDTMTK